MVRKTVVASDWSRQAGFTLRVTAVELSSLIAAVRIAADVLEADERTPPEAVMRLRVPLGDYERAAARPVSAR